MNDAQRYELEALRQMTPQRKLEIMQGMIQLAFELKAAWVRESYPHLDEADVRRRSAELVARGTP